MTDQDTIKSHLRGLSKSLSEFQSELIKDQAERIGFNGSPLQLYKLASENKNFDWLKPLSGLILKMDTRVDDDPAIEPEDLTAFKTEVEEYINAPTGEFRSKLNAAIQGNPGIGAALGGVRQSMKILARDKS